MKKFFLLRYSFDLVILGMPEPREIELDLKILQFDEKFTLKGIPGFLDLSPFNSVWEGEVETVKGEKNIPQRKWEMIPVEDYPMEGIPVFKK